MNPPRAELYNITYTNIPPTPLSARTIPASTLCARHRRVWTWSKEDLNHEDERSRVLVVHNPSGPTFHANPSVEYPVDSLVAEEGTIVAKRDRWKFADTRRHFLGATLETRRETCSYSCQTVGGLLDHGVIPSWAQ